MYDNNKEKYLETCKKYRDDNKEKRSLNSKHHYNKNKLKYKETRANYYIKNKDKIDNANSEYYKNNKDRKSEYAKKYVEENKQKVISYRKDYWKKRRKTDCVFRLTDNLRSRVSKAIKRNSKSKGTLQLLGCNGLQFKEYLQKGFTKRMNWENYGSYWHVDHIGPLASFDMSKPKEQQKAFHFTNCQPLEAKENMSKSDKWDGQTKMILK